MSIKYAADVVNLADSKTPTDSVAKSDEYCETIKSTIERELAYLPRVLEESEVNVPQNKR